MIDNLPQKVDPGLSIFNLRTTRAITVRELCQKLGDRHEFVFSPDIGNDVIHSALSVEKIRALAKENHSLYNFLDDLI